jgi:hypothetical protein
MVIRWYTSNKEAFTVLGLPNTASKKEIKQRYYELAQKHHPDKTGLKTNDFLKIKNAYEILSKDQIITSSPTKRRRPATYDRDFGPAKILTSSMLIGIGTIVVSVTALWMSLLESRANSINDAWDMHARQRAKDGLDRALGYEKKKASD